MNAKTLRADALHLQASSKTLVHHCSFDCTPGRFLAIIGPNGAGKTSLLRGLAGLNRPTNGCVLLGDEDIHMMPVRALARARAVLLRHAAQGIEYGVLETVLMGAHAHESRWSMSSASARSRALAALSEVGMEQMARRLMSTLSTGEAQRVNVARMMMAQALWWMLDEPLSNLDIKHQQQVMQAIRARCDSGGGCVGILHDLNHVQRWADDVLVMEHGHVRGFGPTEQVLTTELLSEVFGVRLERLEHRGRVWWDVR